MKQNMGRLIRYLLILHKLSGNKKYIPAEELISYLNFQMELRGFEIGISQRTIQRDIKEILQMFDVDIRNYRYKGYYKAEQYKDTDIRYEELLLNFDLLTSINQEDKSLGYIIPEHHRPKGCDSFPSIINAIKHCKALAFDYMLVRHDHKLISKIVKPYFIKESLGLWYTIAFDKKENLRVYAVDRMKNIHISDYTFRRKDNIDPEELFKHSYGIWDDETLPIEEIELSYSPLDGYFLKTTPLHSSQEILIDNNEEFRIRLNLRITNDFVMALLARSNSLTVIKPLSLRRRISEVYRHALNRNNI